MRFIADFHIHSKYSRATARDMDLESLDKWAKIKGISVLGTGDFTHPEWFKNLKEKLQPAEAGLYRLKSEARSTKSETRFILTAEISCIYSKKNKVRKIHVIVFAPSFEAVEKINTHLGWIGNLKSDGRPILGLDAKELAKIVLDVSQDCFIVPAHCLPPDTFIHIEKGVKKICDIKKGERVYTHKGRLKKIEKVLKRSYSGKLFTIKPFYFRLGLSTTPEHPYFIIKNDRYKGENNYYGERLKKDYFRDKKPQWTQASEVKVGDILLYPRFRGVEDTKNIQMYKYLNPKSIQRKRGNIAPIGSKISWVPNLIKVDDDFCRLVGYYLAEGYTNSRDAVCFCFHNDEKRYTEDIIFLMNKVFGLKPSRISKRDNCNGIELIYYSKILNNVFGLLFYNNLKERRAHTKAMPEWMLKLPPKKQVEIFKGWWRGDSGVTTSRTLINQMKIILLRLGVIPSIHVRTREQYERNKHYLGSREIIARHDLFSILNLSFFEDRFNLLREQEFIKWNFKTVRRVGWIDKDYIYLPVKEITQKKYHGEVYNLEVEHDNSYVSEFAIVHNCWTPWFSIFGSKSGFNSIEECFEDYSKYIFAIETGLSSDPAMNWRLSALDKVAVISNSDCHSPSKIGREANVFDLPFLSYSSITTAIKSKDPQNFLYTIEFFPEEGKYHHDGHRACGISLSPEESKKYNNTCPTCGKPLVIGVMNRVAELADRPAGFKPEGAIPFKSLVPLVEIIAESLGVGTASKQVAKEYKELIKKMGSEFSILLESSIDDLSKATLPEIAEGIKRVREGKLFIEPGYDGVYGKIKIFSGNEQKKTSKQKTLF